MKTACCIVAVAAVLLVDIWACAPPAPGPAANATADTAGRKKRSLDQVSVTLVTNADFNEETNGYAYQKVKEILATAARQQGVKVDRSQFTEKVKNEVGKFAIEYSGPLDCDMVTNFIKGIKAATQELAYVLVNCPGRNLQIL